MVLQIFDIELYYSQLKTKYYGRPCVYLDRVESTIDVSSNHEPNTIVLAREQTNGRGQRNNIWHSPPGCAMASLRLSIKKLSTLSNRICFLQHIMALAISRTLEQIDHSKLGNDCIKLKWPNDIVYHTKETENKSSKIGGILVNTRQLNEFYDVTLSFGLNVFNDKPTTCLSKILGSKDNLSIESVVANIMNNLEKITCDFDDEKFQNIKRDYTDRCIQINSLIEDELNGKVLVKEVNDDGYLIGEKYHDKQLCIVTRII